MNKNRLEEINMELIDLYYLWSNRDLHYCDSINILREIMKLERYRQILEYELLLLPKD